MFRYLLLSLLITTSGLSIYSQSGRHGCPRIDVTGPSDSVIPGDTAIFSVNVSDLDHMKLKYRWTVSAGTIERGSNTPSVVVRTTESGMESLTATVEIEGLPNHCSATESHTTAVRVNCGTSLPVVEYGRVSPRYELQQIKAAVGEWRERDPSNRLLIILYSDNTRDHEMVEHRVRAISKHLADLGLSKDNYAIVKSRTGVYRTKIYIIPPAGKC